MVVVRELMMIYQKKYYVMDVAVSILPTIE